MTEAQIKGKIENQQGDKAQNYQMLGDLYVKQKKLVKALQCFQKSLSINGNNSESFYNIGRIYLLKRVYDLAYKNTFKANQLNPSNYKYQALLGRIYLQQNIEKQNLQEAQKWLNKSLKNNPQNQQTLILYGDIFQQREEHIKAQKIFKDCIQKQKTKDNPNFMKLGRIFFNQIEFDSFARQAFQLAINQQLRQYFFNEYLNFMITNQAQTKNIRIVYQTCLTRLKQQAQKKII